MQNIYLAKPGGQKVGPYTLEQINRDLAAKKYSDADFWAWHEGLPAWLPLHSLPGVVAKAGAAAAPEAKPELIAHEVRPVPTSAKVEAEATPPKIKPEPVTPAPAAKPAAPKIAAATEPVGKAAVEAPKVQAATSPVAESRLEMPKPAAATAPGREPPKAEAATVPVAKPEPKPAAAFAAPSMSSGKPFSALEQIFVFTTGEGPTAFKSEITTAMLVEAAGEKLENIRSRVPVDVIGGADADVLEAIRAGSIPASAWRALLNVKPAVAQQAREGMYHLCVRTFPVESKALVALILLYNKQKL
jgi:hypothetical protein